MTGSMYLGRSENEFPTDRRIAMLVRVFCAFVAVVIMTGCVYWAMTFLGSVAKLHEQLRHKDKIISRINAENAELLLRARTAESQLEMMLQSGDRGILVGAIDTAGMGPVELRISPKAR